METFHDCVSLAFVAETSLMLAWSTAPGGLPSVQSVRVTVLQINHTTVHDTILDAQKLNHHEVVGLKEGTSYLLSVQVLRFPGLAWSDSEHVRLCTCSSPKFHRLCRVSDTQITVNWFTPSVALTPTTDEWIVHGSSLVPATFYKTNVHFGMSRRVKYEVEVKEETSGSERRVLTEDESTTKDIAGLTGNSPYDLRVRCCHEVVFNGAVHCWGTWSLPARVRTKPIWDLMICAGMDKVRLYWERWPPIQTDEEITPQCITCQSGRRHLMGSELDSYAVTDGCYEFEVRISAAEENSQRKGLPDTVVIVPCTSAWGAHTVLVQGLSSSCQYRVRLLGRFRTGDIESEHVVACPRSFETYKDCDPLLLTDAVHVSEWRDTWNTRNKGEAVNWCRAVWLLKAGERWIQLQWGDSNDEQRPSPPCTQEYSIEVVTAEGEVVQSLRFCTRQTTYFVNGLCPASQYSIRMRSLNHTHGVWFPFSNSLAVRTLKEMVVLIREVQFDSVVVGLSTQKYEGPTEKPTAYELLVEGNDGIQKFCVPFDNLDVKLDLNRTNTSLYFKARRLYDESIADKLQVSWGEYLVVCIRELRCEAAGVEQETAHIEFWLSHGEKYPFEMFQYVRVLMACSKANGDMVSVHQIAPTTTSGTQKFESLTAGDYAMRARSFCIPIGLHDSSKLTPGDELEHRYAVGPPQPPVSVHMRNRFHLILERVGENFISLLAADHDDSALPPAHLLTRASSQLASARRTLAAALQGVSLCTFLRSIAKMEVKITDETTKNSVFHTAEANPQLRCLVAGLNPNTLYTISMRPYLRGGSASHWGAWSDPVTICTQRPLVVEVSSIGEDFIRVNWSRTYDAVVSSAMRRRSSIPMLREESQRVSEEEDGELYIQSLFELDFDYFLDIEVVEGAKRLHNSNYCIPSASTSYTISSLPPSQTYRITVRQAHHDGTTEGTTVTATTVEPLSLTKVELSDNYIAVLCTGADRYLNVPNGRVEFKVVKMPKGRAAPQGQSGIPIGQPMGARLDYEIIYVKSFVGHKSNIYYCMDLNPGEHYGVSGRAHVEDFVGRWSSMIYFSTPPMPVLHVSRMCQRCCVLNWDSFQDGDVDPSYVKVKHWQLVTSGMTKDSGVWSKSTITTFTTDSIHLLRGLKADSEYKVLVRASYGEHVVPGTAKVEECELFSEWSEALYVHTLPRITLSLRCVGEHFIVLKYSREEPDEAKKKAIIAKSRRLTVTGPFENVLSSREAIEPPHDVVSSTALDVEFDVQLMVFEQWKSFEFNHQLERLFPAVSCTHQYSILESPDPSSIILNNLKSYTRFVVLCRAKLSWPDAEVRILSRLSPEDQEHVRKCTNTPWSQPMVVYTIQPIRIRTKRIACDTVFLRCARYAEPPPSEDTETVSSPSPLKGTPITFRTRNHAYEEFVGVETSQRFQIAINFRHSSEVVIEVNRHTMLKFVDLGQSSSFRIHIRNAIPVIGTSNFIWDSWYFFSDLTTIPRRPTVPVLYEYRHPYISFYWSVGARNSDGVMSVIPPVENVDPEPEEGEVPSGSFEIPLQNAMRISEGEAFHYPSYEYWKALSSGKPVPSFRDSNIAKEVQPLLGDPGKRKSRASLPSFQGIPEYRFLNCCWVDDFNELQEEYTLREDEGIATLPEHYLVPCICTYYPKAPVDPTVKVIKYLFGYVQERNDKRRREEEDMFYPGVIPSVLHSQSSPFTVMDPKKNVFNDPRVEDPYAPGLNWGVRYVVECAMRTSTEVTEQGKFTHTPFREVGEVSIPFVRIKLQRDIRHYIFRVRPVIPDSSTERITVKFIRDEQPQDKKSRPKMGNEKPQVTKVIELGRLTGLNSAAVCWRIPLPPPPVVDFEVVSVRLRSACAKWSFSEWGNQSQIHFAVFFSSGDSFEELCRTSAPYFVISKLNPGVQYKVYIQVCTTFGRSKASKVVSFTTLKESKTQSDPPELIRAFNDEIQKTQQSWPFPLPIHFDSCRPTYPSPFHAPPPSVTSSWMSSYWVERTQFPCPAFGSVNTPIVMSYREQRDIRLMQEQYHSFEIKTWDAGQAPPTTPQNDSEHSRRAKVKGPKGSISKGTAKKQLKRKASVILPAIASPRMSKI